MRTGSSPVHGRTVRRSGRQLLAAFAVLVLVAAGCSPATRLQAISIGGVATTGPLYAGGAVHGCTASVLSSTSEDLLLTAAHCVSGTGRGMTFVPGSVDGSAPYGRWTVNATYADPGWLEDQDPLRDVAILRVSPQTISGALRHVQELTGGNRLIVSPDPVGLIVVPAYLAGVGGHPITCLAAGYRAGAYPAFDCGGYSGGTSGAPFIQASSVLGVIGGLHQGGCSPATSYSSPFDASTVATLVRAERSGPADVLPLAGSDGC